MPRVTTETNSSTLKYEENNCYAIPEEINKQHSEFPVTGGVSPEKKTEESIQTEKRKTQLVFALFSMSTAC